MVTVKDILETRLDRIGLRYWSFCLYWI